MNGSLTVFSISSKFLYPLKSRPEHLGPASNEDNGDRGESDGRYELFAQLDNTVTEEIKELVLGGI